ncbi:MAG: ATP-binding protein [Bacteroidetes bacterium]|nr:ATP-binding protein [Bacteroidota bacterium]
MKPGLQHQCSLILLRGLPGSGKSTLAALLSENGKYPVLSIDSYFTHVHTGEYNFDHKKNHLAYTQCEKQTKGKMEMGCPKILVDNTFTLEWEMEPYFKLAAEYDYRIFVITVENRHGGKNIHNISIAQMEKMADKYKVKLMP